MDNILIDNIMSTGKEVLIKLFNSIFKYHEHINVIIIGAMDGVNYDPISHFFIKSNISWKGLAIEPVPYYFKQLENNLQNKSIIPVNVAIDTNDGIKEMYAANSNKIKQDNLPHWLNGCSTFTKNEHVDEYPQAFDIIKVETISVKTLLEKHNIIDINYIQIDTEGFDWIIFKEFINLNKYPRIFKLEHSMLSRQEFIELMSFIKDNYNIAYMDINDIIAYKN